MSYAEENPYISVLEGKEWNTKGPYMTALELDEDVNWTKDSGASVLHMCYEIDQAALAFSGLSMGGIRPQGLRNSPAVASEAGSSASGLTGLSGVSALFTGQHAPGSSLMGTFKEKLVMVLQVPAELENHTDKGLHDAWKKYKAYLDAAKKLDELWDAGQLRNVFDRKPVQTDLKSLFKAKTQWHETYQKTFPRLYDHPDMVAWLEDQEDKQPDVDLWGINKASYTFADLKAWLANDGEGLELESGGSDSEDKVMKKKGKGKGKRKGETRI